MTFKESIQTCFSKYADFNGRASRPEYWWFFLFLVLVGIVLDIICHMVGSFFPVYLQLATLLPSLAVAARRMHDTDKSGWLLLIGIIPLVGLVLLYFLAQPGKEPNRFGPAAST